jgi:malonate transporter
MFAMASVLLDSLVPIFAVMALGYFAGWVRDIDNSHIGELNALVTDFALPAALFSATASTSWDAITALWPLMLVISISMLAIYGLSYWMQRRLFGLSSSAASVQALTVALPNYAAAGLPIIAAVFNNSHAIYVALTLALGNVLILPLTLAVLEANKSTALGRSGAGVISGAVGRALHKPIVLSPILGLLFAYLALPLPEFVLESFNLIGQAAGGVAAFLTGLILSSQQFLLNSNVVSGTLLKNAVQPLSAAGLILLLPLHDDAARATILLIGAPAGFLGVLFGLRYGVKSREAGSTLIASSISSAVTLAAILVLSGGS